MNRLDGTDRPPARRTFKLDKSDARLMGVCAGAARYFDKDVTAIRIALVLVTILLTGLTIPLYIATGLIAD